MDKDEKLSEWIDSLTEETKDGVLFQLINRLIEIEEICYYPEDGENVAPYWDGNGEPIDED